MAPRRRGRRRAGCGPGPAAMVFLVALSNDARERALEASAAPTISRWSSARVDSSMSRSEAALGRFVLDEEVSTAATSITASGASPATRSASSNGWSHQPDQRQRVDELQQLYAAAARSSPLAARAAAAKQGQGGTTYYYAGRQVPDRPGSCAQARRDRGQRAAVAARAHRAKPDLLRPGRPADRFSELARHDRRAWRHLPRPVAIQAVRQNAATRRQAESEVRARRSARAGGRRTQRRSCRTPTKRCSAEAVERQPPRPSCARCRRWKRSAS